MAEGKQEFGVTETKNKFQRQSDKVSIDHTIAIVRDFEGEKSFSGVVKIKPQFKWNSEWEIGVWDHQHI